ncbi:hypothetical protein D1007_48334 [Hordeum vulgare]|nr:hypothetical protein D1007_48334 [Hordeum vulgare]
MADDRWARTECRATHVAKIAPRGPAGVRPLPSPVVNTATGPNAHEQQGSSQPATEQADGRTATSSLVRPSRSVSRARPEMSHGRRALAKATELFRYRPAPDHHNWLQRIEELVAAAGDSAAFSCSLRPQPSLANDEEQDTQPPPPWRGANPEPRQEPRPRDRPHGPKGGAGR